MSYHVTAQRAEREMTSARRPASSMPRAFHEQFPDHPNTEPRKVIQTLLCNETIKSMRLNVLSKCFQVPVPVVWKLFIPRIPLEGTV